jgi:glycosyltransferase involved in cell wall biosynthesis
MRILFLGEMMPTSSCSYRIRYTEAKKLAERGHGATYITPDVKRRWTAQQVTAQNGFVVLHSPGLAPAAFRRGGFSLLDLCYKLWFVLKEDFDVVHTTSGHRPAQLIPALAARYLKGCPIVDEWWEWYGPGGRFDMARGVKGRLIGLYDRLFELPTKSLYSAVIAISSTLKARLKHNSHVHVLHGGVEVDHLSPINKNEARDRLGLPPDLFIAGLVSMGRADHPDLKPFIEAFHKLTGRFPNLRLFVTGEADYIKEQLLEGPSSRNVIYKGWLELHDYSSYLSACDLFVLPLSDVPRNAGRWPHKIGDFLLFERPILSNPTGGLSDLFSNNRIGYLCSNTGESYIKILPELISIKDDLHTKCAESHKTALNLSSDLRVDKMVQIYSSISGNKS